MGTVSKKAAQTSEPKKKTGGGKAHRGKAFPEVMIGVGHLPILQLPPKPTEWAIATAVGCPPELGGKNLLLDPLQAPLEIISRAQF